MTAFIFDVDDTLYDQMIPFCTAFNDTFSRQEQIPYEGLYVAYRKYSEEVFDASENGLISMEEMYIYRMSKAMADYQFQITGEEALAFQKNYREAQNHLVISDGMKEILDFCQTKGIPTGVISNGPAVHQSDKIKRLGVTEWILPGNIYISGELRISKPDPQIFSHVEDQMGLTGDCTYYIGDSYANDVVGARQAGWKSVWFNRRGHKLDKLSIQPDHVVSDEKQLYRLIHSLAQQK